MDVYPIRRVVSVRLILLVGDSMAFHERRSSSFICG